MNASDTRYVLLVSLERQAPGLNHQLEDSRVAFWTFHEEAARAAFDHLGRERTQGEVLFENWRMRQLCECLHTALDYLGEAGKGKAPDPAAMFALCVRANKVL